MAAYTQTKPSSAWHLELRDEVLEPLFVALTLVGIVAGIVLERLGASPAVLLVVHVATRTHLEFSGSLPI